MYRGFSLLLALVLSSAAFAADDLDSHEQAVWELEESYYQYVKNNDPASYLNLFHENSIGWPTMDPLPKGKDRVSQWIGMVHSDPSRQWNYEIERLAIESFDNVVVVHYQLHEFYVSSQTGEELSSDKYRISHTWLRVDDSWKLISGMGGKFN